jgi:hypothetical protein
MFVTIVSFLDALENAKLLQKHGDKTRVLDVSEQVASPEGKSDRIKKLGADVAVKAGETCFVMQPFAAPYGDYYETIYRPAIEKTGLQPVKADAEILLPAKSSLKFGAGSILQKCSLLS